MKLLALAPAKVNLCLFLGGLREDGRHELVTLLQSLSLADTLTLETVGRGAGDARRVRDQVVCPAVAGENLAATALARLREHGWDAPAVRIEIDKQIPIAAGMAGGSADAAAVLRLATAVAAMPDAELQGIAAELGSDVPSQLLPGLALGTGAGELVQTLPALGPHAYTVIPSAQALSTAAVYREADRIGLGRSANELEALYAQLVAALSAGGRIAPELIVNDLQPAAVSLCPSIGLALGAALAAGAEQAIVSGSGPTVVGIFWGADAALRAASAAQSLAAQYPGTVSALPVGPDFGAAGEV